MTIEGKVMLASFERNGDELALGWLRYEALRKLSARRYAELCDRNLKGERFDDMVDKLVLENEP